MSNALTSDQQPLRGCKYPGCHRPAEPAPAGGRPPAYCDRADHNPTSAFRARQHAETASEGDQEVAPGPLSAALAELGGVRGELGAHLASHHQTVSWLVESALEALSTVADPSQVEAERHALAAEADQRVAAAHRQVHEAEQARATAQHAADTAGEQARADRQAAADADQRAQTAQAARDEALGERDAAVAARQAAEEEATVARQQAAEADQRAEHDAEQCEAAAVEEATSARSEPCQPSRHLWMSGQRPSHESRRPPGTSPTSSCFAESAHAWWWHRLAVEVRNSRLVPPEAGRCREPRPGGVRKPPRGGR